MTDSPDTEARLAEAIDHHRRSRFDEAEAIYNEVLAREPDHVHALSVSAILLHDKGDNDGAIARLRKAIELSPDTAALHNNLANILRLSRQQDAALAAYEKARALDPANVEVINNIALIHRGEKRINEAAELLQQAVAIAPHHAEANHNLGLIFLSAKMYEEAVECFERIYAGGGVPVVNPLYHVRVLRRLGRDARADEILKLHAEANPDDPVLQYEIQALEGKATDRAPDAYVRKKFDDFAADFDSVLALLNYSGPEEVAKRVTHLCGNAVVPLMVDLGCGTGLVGPLVKQHCRTLIGVDLSVGMMAQAAERRAGAERAYDKLVEAEITEFMQAMPQGQIDIACAADTLVYLGKLEEFFLASGKAIRKGGAFVSSFEQAPDDEPGGIKFLESGRYAHSNRYLHEVAELAGFKVRSLEHPVLRKEFGEDVKSSLLIFENVSGHA